jgi:hypothetical protein
MFKGEFIGIKDVNGRNIHEGQTVTLVSTPEWKSHDDFMAGTGVVRYQPHSLTFKAFPNDDMEQSSGLILDWGGTESITIVEAE